MPKVIGLIIARERMIDEYDLLIEGDRTHLVHPELAE